MCSNEQSVFSVLSFDRSVSRWEDTLYALTPVQQRGYLYLKRDDLFAPIGCGCENGTKMRQCIHLISSRLQTHPDTRGVVFGSSLHSPQVTIVSAVARHFGLECVYVIGATKPAPAFKHDAVATATWYGTRFFINPDIAYNPVLQRRVKELTGERPEWFSMGYAISADSTTPGAVSAFHSVTAVQTQNIPDDVTRIILPEGSGNSAVSVLFGLAKDRKQVEDVWMFGLGPSRLHFIEQRLETLRRETGVETRIFARDYRDNRKDEAMFNCLRPPAERRITLHLIDLFGIYPYSTLVPAKWDGVALHPRYEGKVLTYLQRFLPGLLDERTLFWIVAAEAHRAALPESVAETLGEFPARINQFN